MSHTQFVIAMTIVLFLAFGLGWFASWLVHRLTRVTQAAISDLDQMAHDLHLAQEQLEDASTYFQRREHELTTRLAQTEAELNAAMDGLGDARTEAAELRAYIERVSAR